MDGSTTDGSGIGVDCCYHAARKSNEIIYASNLDCILQQSHHLQPTSLEIDIEQRTIS